MKRPQLSMLVFGPRLVAVVSALTMTQGLPVQGQESYDMGQLQDIERFIVGRDCGGLWSYVQTNPHLAQGEDPLAKELSRFVERTQRGSLDCFGSQQSAGFAAKTRGGLFGLRIARSHGGNLGKAEDNGHY